MAKPVLLNNIEHKDLRIINARSARYGDELMYAQTFPAEFRDLQAYYPIVFHKTPDGTSFEALALFGFQDGENLFLSKDKDGWDASYVPLMVERQPFLIGRQHDGEMVVHLDIEHPRVSTSEGHNVFLPHGANTEYLEQVTEVLYTIHKGLETMPDFIAALLEYELLEGFVVDVTLNDGSQGRLAGFYTINEERLTSLDSAAIERLHKANYLQGIYMQLASLSNFRGLIERKNRQLAAQA